MNESLLLHLINQHMTKHSGLEEHRDYLGISWVSGCPREAYNNYVSGMKITPYSHRMAFAGYEQEASLMKILLNEHVIVPPSGEAWNEVVAPFDNRLRGHVDAITREGELIEIKSVSLARFDVIKVKEKALPKHFEQCQLYMRYGGFPRAFVIYRCRENYDHEVIGFNYLEHVAEKFEEKAKRILRAIDAQTPPPCECDHCE